MKKQIKRIQFFVFMLTMVFVAPVHAEDLTMFEGHSGSIKISGGTAHIPVMKAMAQKIMSAYPDIKISIAGGGQWCGNKTSRRGLGGYRQFRP